MPQSRRLTSLKTWPNDQRPRERLLSDGVHALSESELLAILLRSGLPGENVRDLSLRLIQTFGGLAGLSQADSGDLMKVSGLGPAKVTTLLAAFEIGNRLLSHQIQDRPLADCLDSVIDYLRHFFMRETEEAFVAVLLDAKNQILKLLLLSRGDPARIVVSVPRVIRDILKHGAAAVIFSHHHPSGDPFPSEKDKDLTLHLGQACQTLEITMHDHIIMGQKDYFSFAEHGLLTL